MLIKTTIYGAHDGGFLNLISHYHLYMIIQDQSLAFVQDLLYRHQTIICIYFRSVGKVDLDTALVSFGLIIIASHDSKTTITQNLNIFLNKQKFQMKSIKIQELVIIMINYKLLNIH